MAPKYQAAKSSSPQRLTRLWVAVGGVIVTLTRSTAGAAEVKETWVAVVALLSVHSRLAHTRPRAATPMGGGGKKRMRGIKTFNVM